MPTVVSGIEGIQGMVGRHLGVSDWVEITQERVDPFAEATGDVQTVAHGYLTLDSATPIDGGVQLVVTVTVEVEGGSRPAMVATALSRRYL